MPVKMMEDRTSAIQILSWFILLYFSVLLNMSHAGAFTINGFPPSNEQKQGVVGPDGTALLTLRSEVPTATPVTLKLTKFRDKRGGMITVAFQKRNEQDDHQCTPTVVVPCLQITLDGQYTIQLDASKAIAGREYSGEISVASGANVSGAKPFQVFPILLKREVLPIIYQTVPSDTKEVTVNVPVTGRSEERV